RASLATAARVGRDAAATGQVFAQIPARTDSMARYWRYPHAHMLAFILRRLAQAVIVMLTVGLIAFSLFRFVGDPVLFMLGQDATPEDRVRITQLLGLDQPFYVQYAKFLGRAVQGNFGLSLRQAQPVSKLIAERLPATLELSMVAALFALAGGISMGVYTALRKNTWLSQAMLAVSLIGVSLP